MAWNVKLAVEPQITALPLIPADPLQFAKEFLNFEPDHNHAKIFDPSIRAGLLCCTRQFGKTSCVAALTLHTALTNPGSTSLVLAPEHTQSGEFLYKMQPLIPKLGIEQTRDRYHRDSFAFPNGSRILAITDTEQAARCYSAKLLVVDEAARVNADAIEAARCTLSRTDGRMWMMSTPRGRTGKFYHYWVNGPADWFRLRVTINEVSHVNPRFLEDERITKGERKFAEEYLCEFRSPVNAIFDDNVVAQALFESETRPDILCVARKYYAGVDLGKINDPSAIVIVEATEFTFTGRNALTWEHARSKEYTIRHIERIPLGTSYPAVARRIKDLVNTPPYQGQISVYMDATGVGNPVFDLLKSMNIGCPINDVTITQEIKQDLVSNLHVMFDMKDLRIPKTLTELPALLHELSSMRATTLVTGNTRYEAAPGEHDDLVIALALAAYPARPRIREVGEKGHRLL